MIVSVCYFCANLFYLCAETASSTPAGLERKKSLDLYNRYGGLLNDDPSYNKKTSVWLPISEVVGVNAVVWSFDRFIANYDYADISLDSWKRNLTAAWIWEDDSFSMNFVLHPICGGAYFNAARANGYDFYEALPFTFGGSVMWKYFGENGPPAYEDVINTTLSGPFVGEVQYRLSSKILNDKIKGPERFWRELFAGIIDPVREFNRIMLGECSRETLKDVYQKEPLNINVYSGIHLINSGTEFGTGAGSFMAGVWLDYGDPFEYRTRKPFDYFNLQLEVHTDPSGNGKILDIASGYGVLWANNSKYKNTEILAGIFHHYDYWDSTSFELASLAFGPGIITKTPIGRNSVLLANFHICAMPLAANSTFRRPYSTDVRDYNYSDGIESKIECALKLNRKVNFILNGYYFWAHTMIGDAGDDFIAIIKPGISYNITESLLVGFEQTLYASDFRLRDYPQVDTMSTEQRIYLSLYFQTLV